MNIFPTIPELTLNCLLCMLAIKKPFDHFSYFFFVSFCRPHCGQRRGKLLRFTIIYAHYIITSTALVYLHMITSCLAPAHTSRIPQRHLLLAGCHTIFALHLRRITARRSLRQTFQPLTFARLEQKVCLTLI